MFLIYGGNGWIGKKIVDILTYMRIEFVVSNIRADDIKAVEHEITTLKPSNVMCLLGRTHGTFEDQYIPTIDYLEKKGKVKENVRDNLFCPVALALLCKKYDIHLTYLGTGCIFTYDENKKIFTEEDEPNFFGSSYSVVKGYTDRLMHMFDNVLNVRIRMPISSDTSSRNFIMKLLKYNKICSMQNSMTVLDELLPIMCDMSVKNEIGTVNLTNPGTIEHSEILDMYKKMVDPNFTFNLFTYEEQMKVIACDRSNNELDNTLLLSKYNVLNIKESVEVIIKKLSKHCEGYSSTQFGDYTLFCGNEFNIPSSKNMVELVDTCKTTCCDILSPIIVSHSNKMIFYGGIVCGDKVIYFDEKYITLDESIDRKKSFNYIKPSMVVFPRFFIIKTSLIKEDFDIDTINLKDFIHYDIRVTPFVCVKQNWGTSYIPAKTTDIKIFNFEEECVLENYRQNVNHGLFPLRIQNRKFLDGSIKKYVLIIESDLLTPDNDCGSMYMFNFVGMLIKNGHNVHFICTNHRYDSKYTIDLQKMGVYVLYNSVTDIKSFLTINCNVYETVFISRFHEIKKYYEVIRTCSPKSKIVFITHDLSSVRNNRLRVLEGKEKNEFEEIEELSYIEQADLTLIVSEFEYNYVKSKGFRKDVFYFPICYPLNLIKNTRDKTDGIYFIGSGHKPNVDGINYFLNNIYGEILKIQKIALYIFGGCCEEIPKDVLKMFGKYVIIKNHINEEDLVEFFKTVRLNIVPLRYGAGVKGKVLQASNNYVPTITTSLGSEGTVFEHEKDIISMELTDPEYASKFVSYYNNVELLTTISANTYETFKDNYSLVKGHQYMEKMVDTLDKIKIVRSKTCVIFNTFNKPEVAKLLYSHLECINDNFDFYLVHTGNETIDKTTYKNIKIVKGDNSMNEFSGIQSCINGLIESEKIEEYTSFIMCNDTLALNYPLDSIYKLTKGHIDLCSRKRKITGHIDSFGENFSFDNFILSHWYRTFFIIINKNLFEDMNYKFMNYSLDDVFEGDELKINMDPKLWSKIKDWLSQERYKNVDIKKKICCIFNEYRFSNEINIYK